MNNPVSMPIKGIMFTVPGTNYKVKWMETVQNWTLVDGGALLEMSHFFAAIVDRAVRASGKPFHLWHAEPNREFVTVDNLSSSSWAA